MKRTKFAGVIAAMLIFGSSTVFGATPSINLQNNTNNTVTVKVQDIQKDIYGIQIELLTKSTLTEDVVFAPKDKDAYSFTVRDGNKLSIYITSNQILNLGQEAILGNLIDMRNDQFLDSASYKVVDYFFSPIDTPNVGVDYTDGNTSGEPEIPVEPGDSDNSSGSSDTGDTNNSGGSSDTDDTNNSGGSSDTDDTNNSGGSSDSGNSNKHSDETESDETEKPVVPSIQFIDTKTHWASEEIGRMAGRGILKGYEDGTFRPSKQITRAEFAAVVARAFGFEETVTTLPFKDTALGKWYTEPVVSLYKKGIVTGRPDGTFGVNDPITNQEIAVMISRSLKALAVELEAERSYVSFKDADAISTFAEDAVKELYEVGIINGMPDGTFKPKDSTTRAQVAVIVDRILIMMK